MFTLHTLFIKSLRVYVYSRRYASRRLRGDVEQRIKDVKKIKGKYDTFQNHIDYIFYKV